MPRSCALRFDARPPLRRFHRDTFRAHDAAADEMPPVTLET